MIRFKLKIPIEQLLVSFKSYKYNITYTFSALLITINQFSNILYIHFPFSDKEIVLVRNGESMTHNRNIL